MEIGDVVQLKSAHYSKVSGPVRYHLMTVEDINDFSIILCSLRTKKSPVTYKGTPPSPESPFEMDQFFSMPSHYVEVIGDTLQELI